MKATLFALLYGDYRELHNRLLGSLARYAPKSRIEVRLWLNTVCPETKARVKMLGFQSFDSAENLPKYTVMRRLFHGSPVKTPWIIWLDDDSYIEKPDWFRMAEAVIRKHPEASCLGEPWRHEWFPGQWDFVTGCPWFAGLPPALIDGKPGIVFPIGAYFWLKTEALRRFDWPHEGLAHAHNGGDYFLAEAMRQQGLRFLPFNHGVVINSASRRGRNEIPIGCTVDVREIPRRFEAGKSPSTTLHHIRRQFP